MNPTQHRQPLRVNGFVFDLDGTIYLGDRTLPGAVECVRELRQRGKRIVFVSNKPLAPRAEYAAKLTRLGIPTDETEIITSAYVLACHLAATLPQLVLYVVGEKYLIDEFKSHGLKVAPEFWDQDPKELLDPQGIDAVVVAFDRTLDYRKLNTAYQALRRGARFFATNADKTCPMPGGAIPDAGATIAALEHISGRKLELLAGKPSALMMQVAANMLGLPPQNCLITGDRLETDVQMGQDAGMQTAVVLTGVSTREMVEQMPIPPNLIIANLTELIELTV
jgi:phosphoglycolate/pyridoxal phosphate phosphatase family enzyme